MSKRGPRQLRADEQELWQQVARTAKPLNKPFEKPAGATPKPKKPKTKPAHDIRSFQIGQNAQTSIPQHDLSPGLSESLGRQPMRMDKKTFGKLKRGKSVPEARIDLHGMTVAAAHSALTSFILRTHGEGKRLVLVITGKGRVSDDADPIPTRTGVLRHQVPHWLAQQPLRHSVLQVVEAHQRHGGSGAFYVYLSRHR